MGHWMEAIREGFQGLTSSSVGLNCMQNLEMNSAIIEETSSFTEVTKEPFKELVVANFTVFTGLDP